MSVVDRALAAAVVRAGAPGRIRFTRRQLYYELCRGLLPLHRLPRRVRFTLPAPVSHERFLAALDRHGPVPGLLQDPAARDAAPHHDDVPDLYDYGLPRLLVCQDPAIAGMLLANELHMESACPVFALPDLPLDPRLTAALRHTGDAVVYVLHDAGPSGYAAVDDVRRWAGDLRVHPLGLRPVHAAALHLSAGPACRAPSWTPPPGWSRGRCAGCGPGGPSRSPPSTRPGCCAPCTAWSVARPGPAAEPLASASSRPRAS
ncbi:hypothetical protein OHA72_32275 [Dactylosporangium sp. NBC_01737]|uniref:hypothetical protein n=1 Tax=Dactylosporangium sp. NBC_01737 TaxID=2975959 RepID=UPI002E1035C2|nr:hypothetical protein OHA72_32275 [Dactylosporangium sp. NBC_01737]